MLHHDCPAMLGISVVMLSLWACSGGGSPANGPMSDNGSPEAGTEDIDGGAEAGPEVSTPEDGAIDLSNPRDGELAAAPQAAGITTWRYGRTGVYSLIHDDFCGSWVSGHLDYALPALAERHLSAAFAVIVRECGSDFENVAAVLAAGHEVVDHSYTHPHLTVDMAADEIVASKKRLERALPGYQVTFFAFPYDEVNPGVLDVLRQGGFLGARGGYGRTSINATAFTDPFVLQFDVFAPTSPQAGFDTDPLGFLNRHVDKAIADGGWAVREIHGIADESYYPVPLDVYRGHLDYLVEREHDGALWVAPPSEVIRYRFAREHCGAPAVSGTQLVFQGADADCTTYRTKLSVRLVAPPGGNLASLRAEQAGPLEVQCGDPQSCLVTVDPLGAPATLQW